MKKLLFLLFTFIISATSFAQDPDLYRTWYLYELQSTDLSQVFIVSQINPEIQPTLSIEPNLDFSGDAACNSFSGTFTYDSGFLTRTNFVNGTDDCGVPVHTFFESDYFDFLELFQFTITSDGNGLTLECNTLLLGYAIFKDYELSVEDNSLSSRIALLPNPASDLLTISSEGVVIESIQVYSISGKLLLSGETNTQSIAVSSLSEGIYLLEIVSENGRQMKKFIKN